MPAPRSRVRLAARCRCSSIVEEPRRGTLDSHPVAPVSLVAITAVLPTFQEEVVLDHFGGFGCPLLRQETCAALTAHPLTDEFVFQHANATALPAHRSAG